MADKILILTSREYYDMSWNLILDNRVDNISGDAIINKVSIEPEEFYTETIDEVTLVGGAKVQLPLTETDDTKPTYYFREIADAQGFWSGNYKQCYKSRQEIVWAKGTTKITPDIPIEGQPRVAMRLNGSSYVLKSPNEDHTVNLDSLPDTDTMFSPDAICAKWIRDNVPAANMTRQDGQLFNHDSESSTLIVTGCLKNTAEQDYDPSITGEQEVKNRCFMWLPDVAAKTSWKCSTDKLIQKGWAWFEFFWGSIPAGINYLPITANLRQTGVREYEIDWEAPVKVSGIGATRSNNAGGEQPGDNYGSSAYVSYVTTIDFVLSARPFNTEKVPYEYIDAQSNKQYPLQLSDAEIITLGSIVNGKLWTEEMPRLIIDKYKNGKYYVQANVNAKWLIDNNIHIDSILQIANINGSLISRKSTPCTFVVKNITKEYSNSAFTFTIHCLEV